MENGALIKSDRREFLIKTFSSCAVCCLSPSILVDSDEKIHFTRLDNRHKFLTDSHMTFKEVFDFAYKESYIPAMKNLMNQIGREKFIELLKKSSDNMSEPMNNNAMDYSKRTLKEWTESIKKECQDFNNQISCEILKENDNEFEITYSECLWAKTFREADASEIGYAGICYQEFGKTRAFNPKLNIAFDQSLMNGNDRCHFKWVI